MNKLVEEIIKPILEANPQIKKIVGIYGGRFQPFGPHHYKTYKWLTKQVDEAYISTSNIKKPPRHPMNFKEKVRHMSKMGVPSSKIIEEKTPYVAKNLQKKFNKDTTAFVYVFGAKDAGRLGGSGKYYKDYKKNKKNLVGYEEHGYYLVAPHVSISVGGMEVSGTTMRDLLGSDKFDDKERAKLFKKMFGYFNQGVFNMMVNKFKKLFEDEVMIFKPTKMKKLKPKWKDGKDKELIKGQKNEAFAVKGSKVEKFITGKNLTLKGKKHKEIDFETIKIDNRTGMVTLRVLTPKKLFGMETPVTFKTLRRGPFLKTDTSKKIKEGVDLPIEIGDTIKMGKFKNKKVVVKSIDWNEKGDLLINGRPALKFRIEKSKEIDEFLIHNDISKIIKEVSNTSGAGGLGSVDSGPSLMFKNAKHYKGRGQLEAEKLGWTVINYIMSGDTDDLPPSEYELLDGWPIGPHNSVSYLPAGIGTGKTPNNQENLTGTKGYDKWVMAMKSVATEVGFELMKFTKQDRDTRAQIAKDTVDTLNTQKEEEVTESVFSKDWWKSLLSEEDVMDKTIKYKDEEGNEKEATVGGILKKGEDHPAHDKAQTMADKDKDKKPVKKTTIDANPFDKEEPKEKSKPKKDDSWMKGKDGWEILDDENVEVAKTKKYSEEQAKDEVGEYFKNDKTLEAVPNLAKDEDELTQKILDAKEETFSSEEIQNIRNTDAGEILDASEDGGIEGMKALGKQKAKEYKKGWDYITKNIESGEPQEAPIAIRDKNNELYLMAGNTRLMSNTAYGRKIPLKVIEYDGEFKDSKNESLTEVSAKTKKFKQKLMRRGIKIRYDKEKAQQDLQQKYGGQGEVVGKKFGLRKAYYAVPKKGFKKDTKPTITINKKEMDKLHTDKQIEKGNLKVLYKEGLLMEGGAYGHMAHPFDDKDLTFGDLKKIIELGLGGQLNREDNVTEKLDGQNIMISWKDGKLIAARNKGHIKNGGKTALTTSGIASKFKGRGDIRNAFVYAMKDLEKSIKGLSDKQKEKIFNNGYNFMNMEVMWPKSANVIDYDIATLIFHGALKYDDSGKVIGEVPGSGRILAGMIEQINQHIQKKYSIGKPNFLKVPKHQDFGKMKGKFLGRLSKLQSKFGLKDNDTLGLYHQMWWEQFITKQSKGKITGNTLKGLVKRWAFFDKSYKIPMIKKDLEGYSEFLEWVLNFDKKNHAAQVKKNMKPFEELFFEVGAEVLKNVKGFIAASPDKAVQGIVKRLDKAISNVRKGGDLKKLNTLKLQLDKLNTIGGTKAIVPSEGLVFKYKGKTYKFTGAFAPINQITGLISF